MTAISKLAGIGGLASCLLDIHKTAMVYSKNEHAKTSANSFVSASLGCQKANDISHRDAKVKNWIFAHNDQFSVIPRVFASVKGYLGGVLHGIIRHFPTLIFAIPAIFVAANLTGIFAAFAWSSIR